MPSIAEYKQILMASTGGVGDFPADTKGDVLKHAAEARRRMIRERNTLTKGISERWKAEFNRIKIENDEWQGNLRSAAIEVGHFIDDHAADLIVGLQK